MGVLQMVNGFFWEDVWGRLVIMFTTDKNRKRF